MILGLIPPHLINPLQLLANLSLQVASLPLLLDFLNDLGTALDHQPHVGIGPPLFGLVVLEDDGLLVQFR
jgi:hypothetical protein